MCGLGTAVVSLADMRTSLLVIDLAKALAEEFGCKSGTTDEAIQCLETKKWEEIRDMTLKWQKKFAPGGPHFDNGEGFFSEDPLDTLTKFER